jgi:SAM-dependent methyltransferase
MSIEKHFSNDGGRNIEWGRTSADYAEHRPDYPAEFYSRLLDLGIGLPGQQILDLGTGVGFLAQNFARQGAQVTGIDIDATQIDVARQRAYESGLNIEYRLAPAEETGLPDRSFDIVSASQCWLYFDHTRASTEVSRLLCPGGTLVTAHLCWLPNEDEIARRSEELVLKYNSSWTGGGYDGKVSCSWTKMERYFDIIDFFVFDSRIPFTQKSWRGRFRACRGVGASLSPEEVAAFDREHAKLLARTLPRDFSVLHRIDCHIMRPRAIVPVY